MSSLHAADGTWTKDATGTQNWSDTANWSGGIVADAIDFSAYLSNVITADRTITLDTARTIGNIYAQDTSNNYTISGANTLTLDVSSGQSILDVVSGRTLNIGTAVTVNDGINKTGAGQVTFTGPITLGAAQTWTNNSSGLLLTGNGTNLINNGGYQLTVNGSGNTTFGVINNAAASLTGSGALVKSGTGILSLSGTNTGFTGNVTVNGGILRVTNPASISGNLNLSGGVYEHYWSDAYTRTLGTGAGQIQITGGTSGFSENGATSVTFTLNNNAAYELVWGVANEAGNANATGLFNPSTFVLQANTAQGASTLTLANKIDLNASNRTISVSGGTTGVARAEISGQIRTSSGTAGLTKEGTGILRITNNASAWNGSTVVNGGLLDMGGTNIASIGGGSGRNITIAAGASIRFNALSNTILSRIVETSNEITVMTGSTSNAFDFSGGPGANLPGAFLSNYATNGAKTELSGIITPGGGAYRLGGGGQSGALGITQTSLLSGANGLIIGGNRVVIVGTHTFTGDTTIRDGGRLGLAGLNTDAGAAKNNSLALQNSVLDLGAPSATGQIFLEANTTAGAITGATTSANGGTKSATFGGLKGSRNLNSAFLFTGPGNNTSATTAANITGFTLNPGTGVTATYSGAIGGFGTGATGSTGGNSTLTKTGDGTQILEGVHTYTGATTITGGTLAINSAGSINASPVTINGGTFRYNSSVAYTNTLTFTSGTIAGTNWTGTLAGQTIGTGQTISPGNSPGTATTGSQTWAGGGSYVWEINNATGDAGANPGPSGWDLLNGTGTLTITASSGSEFDILVSTLTLANAAGLATNFNDALNYTWLIADFASITGFAVSAFNIDTSGFVNPFTGNFNVSLGGVGAVPGDSSQLYLTYTAVPEPRAALLGGLGLLMLLRRRR